MNTDQFKALNPVEAFNAREHTEAVDRLNNGEGESEAPNLIPSGLSFEEASGFGLTGRILWAMTQLGRSPSYNRVYDKAQDPSWGFRQRDTRQAFGAGVQSLVSQGILLYDSVSSTLTLAYNSRQTQLAVKCGICQTEGPPGFGKDEAKNNALAVGFTFDGERFLCPSHSAGAALVPGGPQLHPSQQKSRQQRRAEERKAEKLRVAEPPKKSPNAGIVTRIL